jgi:hypothetical protein
MWRVLLATAVLVAPCVKTVAQSGNPYLTEVDTQAELTEEIIRNYTETVGYVYRIRFSDAQQAQIRRFLTGYWKNNDQARIRDTLQTIQAGEKIMQMPVQEREAFVKLLLPKAMEVVRKEAQRGAEDSKWLLNAYYAAHPPLAKGNPPLVRDMVEAYIESERWHAVNIFKQKTPPLNEKTRAAIYKMLIENYPKLPAEKQRAMAELPGMIATIKLRWSRMSAEERLMMRANVGGDKVLTAQERMMVAQFQQQMNQMVRSHSLRMMTDELNHMRANQQLIMGSAPYWNPSTQRWEQIGGIVTEFR